MRYSVQLHIPGSWQENTEFLLTWNAVVHVNFVVLFSKPPFSGSEGDLSSLVGRYDNQAFLPAVVSSGSHGMRFTRVQAGNEKEECVISA